jgi:hypothetical protein
MHKWAKLVAGILLALLASACSRGGTSNEVRKPVHSVRGQLLVGGKPATGALIVLVPLNEPAEPVDPRPRAEAGADGSFDVSMYGDKDGAPVGDYHVIVLWEGEGGYDKLKNQYSDPTKSKLRVTVKEGNNELPPFKLN